MTFQNLGLLCSVAATLAISACTSKQPQSPVKYAVLRFENLSRDSSLDWVGRAASEVLTKSLGAIPRGVMYQAQQPSAARPVSAPGISTEFPAARLAGATQVIYGYYEVVNGQLRITAIAEDAATGQTTKSVTAAGDVLPALSSLAKEFTASPKPYSTQSSAALQAAVTAMESPAPDEQMFRKAMAADPHYEEGYIGAAEVALAHKDKASLAEIVAQARAAGLNKITLARLDLAAASLSTNPADREQALVKLAAADPSDKSVIRAVADSEFTRLRFHDAATHYAEAADAGHSEIYNLLAYARMFEGDEKSALEAARRYQSLRPADPNAIDTEGDVQYFFSRFADAEKTYLRAAAKDPAFNQGGETWKAARARLLTGDVAGATELYNRYSGERTKSKDPTVGYRDAEWKYLCGARAQAVEDMRKAVNGTSNAALKILEQTQIAIWELQLGKRADAIRDAQLVIAAGQNQSTLAAIVARFASIDPPASADEWRKRADSAFRGDSAGQVRAVALAYTLFLSGHYADAAPLWQKIYTATIPNDQAPAALYAGSLYLSGHQKEAAAVLGGNPIPSVNLAASFECLYFPQYLEWRGDHATLVKLLAAGTAK
jgi:hypothetical protein